MKLDCAQETPRRSVRIPCNGFPRLLFLRKILVDHLRIVERKGNCSVNVGERIESGKASENSFRRSPFAELPDDGFEGHASTRHVVAFVAARQAAHVGNGKIRASIEGAFRQDWTGLDGDNAGSPITNDVRRLAATGERQLA